VFAALRSTPYENLNESRQTEVAGGTWQPTSDGEAISSVAPYSIMTSLLSVVGPNNERTVVMITQAIGHLAPRRATPDYLLARM
jgi:hypothetical protein